MSASLPTWFTPTWLLGLLPCTHRRGGHCTMRTQAHDIVMRQEAIAQHPQRLACTDLRAWGLMLKPPRARFSVGFPPLAPPAPAAPPPPPSTSSSSSPTGHSHREGPRLQQTHSHDKAAWAGVNTHSKEARSRTHLLRALPLHPARSVATMQSQIGVAPPLLPASRLSLQGAAATSGCVAAVEA